MVLVSADLLLRIMSDWQMEIARVGNEREYALLEKVVRCIREQPIAYDVDKVVEQLKEESHETYGHLKIISTEKAVEIAKGGGAG